MSYDNYVQATNKIFDLLDSLGILQEQDVIFLDEEQWQADPNAPRLVLFNNSTYADTIANTLKNHDFPYSRSDKGRGIWLHGDLTPLLGLISDEESIKAFTADIAETAITRLKILFDVLQMDKYALAKTHKGAIIAWFDYSKNYMQKAANTYQMTAVVSAWDAFYDACARNDATYVGEVADEILKVIQPRMATTTAVAEHAVKQVPCSASETPVSMKPATLDATLRNKENIRQQGNLLTRRSASSPT